MLALLSFLAVIAFGLFVARQQLSPSPFRRFLATPWGSLLKAHAALDIALSSNDKLDKITRHTSKPVELTKVTPAHLAMIHNRDRLTRPLAATIVDMALRKVITLQWRDETEEFILHRRKDVSPENLTKADRALIGKLFPNEATDLIIHWRNGDILGNARRLLDKAYLGKSIGYRLQLGMPLGPALIAALLIAIGVMVGTSEVGFISIMMPLLMVIWPSFIFWSVGESLRAKKLHQEVKAERFQARFFIFIAISLGILMSILINVMVLLIAFGIIRTVLLVALGVAVALALAWIRPSPKIGKPHNLAAAFTYSLINKSRLYKDAKEAASKLDWQALPHAIALGAEDFWCETAKLKIDSSAQDNDDGPIDEDTDDTPAPNTDNIPIKPPAGLDVGKQNHNLLATHYLLSHGFLSDLGIALTLNHLTNLKGDFEEYKKLTVKA